MKTIIKSFNIKNFSSVQNVWCCFLVFALLVLFKNILFQCFAFGGLGISLTNAPLQFFSFWLFKGIPSIFLGSFIFLTKRHWWTIIVAFLIDIWAISNLIYFNANDFFLDVNAIFMVDNMDGFWSSLLVYFKSEYLLFILSSVLYIFFLLKMPRVEKRYLKNSLLMWAFVLLYIPLSHYVGWKEGLENRKIENNRTGMAYYWHNIEPLLEPFSDVRFAGYVSLIHPSDNHWEKSYIAKRTISQYFIAAFWYHCAYNYYAKVNLAENKISEDEQKRISDFIEITDSVSAPTNNLIIILVESFESWVLEAEKACSQTIMPNLKSWMDAYPNLLCNHITSQVKHGVSGDGQMMINTGLLPISTGAACRLYGTNTFPNIAHFYEHSLTINPATGAWNQHVVNSRYGIKQLFESENLNCDKDAFEELKKRVQQLKSPYYIQTITVSSHSPFTRVKNDSLIFPKDIHPTLKHYMTSIHYTDSCMGIFFDEFKRNPALQQSTIVITGDHTIFKKMMLKDFKSSIVKYELPIKDEKNFTPLIIYSPSITKDILITDTCYQMDIYPTILSLIGCENYYWKGFGVNVLDSAKRKRRPILPSDAYMLSDKIIRNDYFKKVN